MTDDSPLAFSLPAISRKKVTAAFDGGRLSSDSGVTLLALAERRRAVAGTLAALIADPRDPAHITHTVEDVLRARMLAIACGYPDGNDFNFLRSDPAFKLACGRLPVQFRLILHTAAYWLLLDVRDCIPSWHALRKTEFASILHLLKIAGRIVETASRIRVALASCCPEAELFSLLAFQLRKSGP